MSKGSRRRRENTALVEANWPWGRDGERKPVASPVLHDQVEAEAIGTVGERATVLDVCTDGEGGSSYGC